MPVGFRLGCVVVVLAGALTFGSQVALQAVCCGQPAQTAFPQTMTLRIMHSFFLAAMQLARLQIKVNHLMPKHQTKLHLALKGASDSFRAHGLEKLTQHCQAQCHGMSASGCGGVSLDHFTPLVLVFLRSVRLQLRGPVQETGSMHDI